MRDDPITLAGGLSPRVRGNPPARYNRRGRRRSIPACAGEPTAERYCYGHHRVYPRVCGGTGFSVRLAPVGAGLSPRVRGNRGLGRPVCWA